MEARVGVHGCRRLVLLPSPEAWQPAPASPVRPAHPVHRARTAPPEPRDGDGRPCADRCRSIPTAYLRAWNFSDCRPSDRSRFYQETPRPDGTLLREYEIFAVDREIEIAPGIFFPAWTYNGQVPGPTIRATEGDRVRITFRNIGTHPHTIHFHGWHTPEMDGTHPGQEVQPGDTFVYEFDAEPFGVHLYHCHTVPLKRHIHKGLYGAFIVDPRDGRRPPADEMVMVMNAFDTNFDAENEVYAVNTVANAYMQDPIRVTVGRLVRRVSDQHHRVRPDQQPAPARDVLRRLPDGHVADAHRSTPTR